jgi:hypothetical protein
MASPKKKKVNRDLCRVLTPEFRVSYEHVWKAQALKPTDKPKYSVTMLFPKDTDLAGIKEVIRQAKIAEFGPDKEDWPEGLASPVSDGNKHVDKDTGEIKPGYKDTWVIKATSNEDQKPAVFGEDGQEMIDSKKFYSGCYARAQVLCRVWEYMGKQGIHFILDGVQKTKDGDPFGGKKDLSKVFTPVNSGESDFEKTEVEDFT